MSLNYKFEQTNWGLDITLKNHVCVKDLEHWFKKIFQDIDHVKLNKRFHLILRLDNVDPLCEEVCNFLAIARVYLIGKGLQRSIILSDSSAKIVHLLRALNVIGIYHDQRILIDDPKGNEKAMKWVENGIEP